jgi:hypothetical protein
MDQALQGNDVTITPKKKSVSIIRKKQFALIKPATKTRIDLGLKIKDKPTTDRLKNSGLFGTKCSHRVKLTDVQEIYIELKEWLKKAFIIRNEKVGNKGSYEKHHL